MGVVRPGCGGPSSGVGERTGQRRATARAISGARVDIDNPRNTPGISILLLSSFAPFQLLFPRTLGCDTSYNFSGKSYAAYQCGQSTSFICFFICIHHILKHLGLENGCESRFENHEVRNWRLIKFQHTTSEWIGSSMLWTSLDTKYFIYVTGTSYLTDLIRRSDLLTPVIYRFTSFAMLIACT